MVKADCSKPFPSTLVRRPPEIGQRREQVLDERAGYVEGERVAAEWLLAAQCRHPRDPKANGPT